MEYRILIINPGSTSTKFAVFDGKNEKLIKTIRHNHGELSQFSTIGYQFTFRSEFIEEALEEADIPISSIDCVIGRGGLLKAISGGVWKVNDAMIKNLKEAKRGEHASNLGGGISVGAHLKGKVVDVNNALNGEGPFSPERSGTLPAGQLVKLCFSGNSTEEEILTKLKGNGGLTAYLGTADGTEIEEMIDRGDENAKLIYDAMAYQVAKEIGALSAVLSGNIDGIVLTGGLAYSSILTDKIKEHISFIGKIFIYPGENEIEALRDAAIRVLTGKEDPKEYEN